MESGDELRRRIEIEKIGRVGFFLPGKRLETETLFWRDCGRVKGDWNRIGKFQKNS